MKKLIGFLVVVLLIIAGAQVLRRHQNNPLVLPDECLGRAMYAESILPLDASEPAKREQAFRNYYESFLDAKEQGKYVDCLRQRWSVPWVHAEYRQGRRWLKESKRMVAKNEPLVGQDKRIADVEESFEPAGGGQSLRRVTITLRDGAKQIIFPGLVGEGTVAHDAPRLDVTAAVVSGDNKLQSQQSYLSGLIYFEKGDYEKARNEWTHALQLDPNNSDATAGLAQLPQRSQKSAEISNI